MNPKTNAATSLSATPSPSPGDLSDVELLAATRSLVGRSNQLLGALLAHLAEVEARGVHRTRACSSLYVYCIYELRFSEDEAFRRVAAARLVRRFPALWDAVASGELHLTGLLMLGPHLTEGNISEVLLRAKHRTKKEIARLVRQLDPLPEVPARIEPLGPAPAPAGLRTPTWAEFVGSLCPVRELRAGDRPRDWMENANDTEATAPLGLMPADTTEAAAPAGFTHSDTTEAAAPAGFTHSDTTEAAAPAGLTHSDTTEAAAPAGLTHSDAEAASASANAAASDRAPLIVDSDQAPPAGPQLSPQRYKVQFTASEEYVKLVEEAQALLSHSAARATLDEIHLRAMRALVTELERRKHAVTARPRKPGFVARSEQPPSDTESEQGAQVDPEHPRQRVLHASDSEPCAQGAADPPSHPRRRGRHIPATVRRAVFERDERRCTYTDSSGRRCAETHLLQLHHLKAFALGGEHTKSNLTLRCHAHNALAAEEDFGRERIELTRNASGHEPWAAQHET